MFTYFPPVEHSAKKNIWHVTCHGLCSSFMCQLVAAFPALLRYQDQGTVRMLIT